MKCSNCSVEIDTKFKYSISKNMCPACGSKLMDEEKHSMLNYVISSLSDQDFSKKVDKSIIAEISMFIFDEFLDINDIEEEEKEESYEEEVDKIEESRKLVKEYPQDEDLFGSDQNINEDIEEKAARLKVRYLNDQKKLSAGKKTGVSVRRVST